MCCNTHSFGQNGSDVFISHSEEDETFATELARAIEAEGYTTWYYERDTVPGPSYLIQTGLAIERCRVFLVIISAASLGSFQLTKEIVRAHESGKPFLPLLYNVTHSELRIRQPEWREAIGAASSIQIPTEGITQILPRLLRGLKNLGSGKNTLETGAQAVADPERPVHRHTAVVPLHRPGLSIATIDDVVAWGWTGDRLLDELIQLDYETMDGLTADHEGETNQWAPVFMDHPDTWRLLVERPYRVAGYWHFVPLFALEHELAKQGTLLDSRITTDKIRVFELPGYYDIYFVTLAIVPRFRHPGALRLLLDSLADVLISLATENVFIRDITANAYTASGEELCKSFGLEYLGAHSLHGKIYSAPAHKLFSNALWRRYPRLLTSYAVATATT